MNNIVVLTAWPYANGPRHIGHVVGFAIPADIFSRYNRMINNNVIMLSGTDEYGTPISLKAQKEGVNEESIADRYNKVILNDLYMLGISYNLFTRTSTSIHHNIVHDIFIKLFNNGYIYKDKTINAIAGNTGDALPDRYIEGICPYCNFANARGDQCDNCGKLLEASQLINPVSVVDGKAPIFKEDNELYLNIPKLKYDIKQRTNLFKYSRKNVKSFADNLLDSAMSRAITRAISWGVKLPDVAKDLDIDIDKKRFYVWFDALIGYISAHVEYNKIENKDKLYWNDKDSRIICFIGKDNIVFHSQILPAILIGCSKNNIEFYGPHDIVASEFLTYKLTQLSTSRGNVVYINELINKFGIDTVRFSLSYMLPELRDVNFTFEEFKRINNQYLVGMFGNLLNRTVSMISNYFDSVIPKLISPNNVDNKLLNLANDQFLVVGDYINIYQFKNALDTIMNLVKLGNKYLSDNEPWNLTDKIRIGNILHIALQIVSDCNIMLHPFMPLGTIYIYQMLHGVEINSTEQMPQIVNQYDEKFQKEYQVLYGQYLNNLSWKRHLLKDNYKITRRYKFNRI